MPPSRESSVLFALDELRDIEEIRKRDQREVARKQARERTRILQEAETRRAEAEREAEREASELVRLQVQVADDARSRRILEAQLAADAQTNVSLQSRLRMLETNSNQPSAAIVAQGNTNRIHAAWAVALVATLGAFLLLSQRSAPPPAVASAAPLPIVVPADCPQPEASPRPAATPVLIPEADASPAATKTPPKDNRGNRGNRGNREERGNRGGGPKPIDISACTDDPLGCMPE